MATHNNENTSSSHQPEENQWRGQSIDDGPEPSLAESTDLHVRSPGASDAGDSGLPLPVWMRESSKTFKWKKVPLSIRKFARSVNRFATFADEWSRGPKEPNIQRIEPFFPIVQEAPLWLVNRYLPKRVYKFLALFVFYLAWLLTFCLIIRSSAKSGHIEGYGTPNSIWCGASFWNGGNGCGLNGNDCRPFADATFSFRCSANCAGVEVLNPYPLGDQEIVYRPLVVGGSDSNTSEPIYRADSFICQAAVHAGVVSNSQGGCGVLLLKGSQSHFPGSKRNGIQSIDLNAEFPKSYTFLSDLSSDCGVVDMRWPLLGVTVTFTTILSILTSSPAVFFFSIFTMLFAHVGFVSDPPNILDYSSLASVIIERFLPACFIAFVFYRYAVRRTLSGLTAQLEKTVLWLGAAWVGALNNYTFKYIPIQRLTPHDIRAQPGGVLALVLIILLIFFIALGQIYYLRLEHRFRQYLALYAVMGAALLVGVALPTLNLRIHHYILAMLLIPGTSMQTRPSLVYQGLLVGLFINGVARWGFDSVLQTSAALFGGGPTYSAFPNITTVPEPDFDGFKPRIRFSWPMPPEGYDGISVLVNDVERHRWYVGEGNGSFVWGGGYGNVMQGGMREHRDFFRFAYMRASSAADYTKAGVWERNGSWTGISEQ